MSPNPILHLSLLSFLLLNPQTHADPLRNMPCALCEAALFVNNCSHFSRRQGGDPDALVAEDACEILAGNPGRGAGDGDSKTSWKDCWTRFNCAPDEAARRQLEAEIEAETVAGNAMPDIRVSKAMSARRNYNLVRVTVISENTSEESESQTGTKLENSESSLAWD